MFRYACGLMTSLVATAVLAADPIVIAHRGASGYLPEHTIAAYERAIDLGADFIEPDLVITRDGELVARHDIYLGTTTNVAEVPRFSDRRKVVDGREDWFVEDFTLQELRELRARQAFPGRTREFDDRFPIPTFQEVIDLVQRKREETGRRIGIYPETKAPSHYQSLGHDFAGILLSQLARNGLNSDRAPVFVQSFEPGILKTLRELSTVRLVMLVSPQSREALTTPNIPLEEIATFADGVGPLKVLLMNLDGTDSGFVAQAHSLGLTVHAWTFRDDAYSEAVFDSAEAEIEAFLELGIDGFFTDFADTGVNVRNAYLLRSPRIHSTE